MPALTDMGENPADLLQVTISQARLTVLIMCACLLILLYIIIVV